MRVTDTGAGIPAELQPKAFDAFFTTKVTGEGSGLGLHIPQGNQIVDKQKILLCVDDERFSLDTLRTEELQSR